MKMTSYFPNSPMQITDLPNIIIIKILELLPYHSRISFGSCSKKIQTIEHETHYRVLKISMQDVFDQNKMPRKKQIVITITRPFERPYIIRFLKKRNDTRVYLGLKSDAYRSIRSEPYTWILKNTDFVGKALAFYEGLTMRSRVFSGQSSLKFAQLGLEYPMILDMLRMDRIDVLEVGVHTMDQMNYVLDRLQDLRLNIKVTELFMSSDSEVFDAQLTYCMHSQPNFRRKHVNFIAHHEITMEYFFSLKYTRMSFLYSSINSWAINYFIKQWMEGNGIAGFQLLEVIPRDPLNERHILRGITFSRWSVNGNLPRVVRSLVNREQEAQNCVQIESSNGEHTATLVVMEKHIKFAVTGKMLADGTIEFGFPN
ncbi:unnamed protein product [Caenorhabditis bovis]|uniref:F-box domain-containing protein n=1 Tax=Caenorhabditis bovis TaxID=2654633 RepID=A0A8S1ENR4_9PELO|nr:unnamed protein product [Caenorhabditis bovis]